MISVPLLAFFIPLQVATPLGVLLSITVAAVVVAQDWRKVHLLSARWLVLSSLPGIPLGVLLLASSHQELARGALGVILLAFSAYALAGRNPFELTHDSRGVLFLCGFLAGILGGAFGMNGPPLVIYGTMRRWSPQQFRATLQAYFLPASLIGLFGYLFAGLWVREVTRYYLLSLPVVVPTVYLGRFINHRLRGHTFIRYIYVGLTIIGVILLRQSIWGHH